jgi:hypothetical protein
MIGDSKVAVRLTNCPTGTPIRVPAPVAFDELIVVLGPNSWMRPEGIGGEFICYRLGKAEVLARFRKVNGMYLGDSGALPAEPDRVVSLG